MLCLISFYTFNVWCFSSLSLSQKPRSEPPPQFSLPLTATNTQSAHSLTRGLTAIRTPCCSGEKERESEQGRENREGGQKEGKKKERDRKREVKRKTLIRPIIFTISKIVNTLYA